MNKCPYLEICEVEVDAEVYHYICLGEWKSCKHAYLEIEKKPREWEKEDIQTSEEKEWNAYEEGWNQGYQDGIRDFIAVEREKNKLREKGLKVI